MCVVDFLFFGQRFGLALLLLFGTKVVMCRLRWVVRDLIFVLLLFLVGCGVHQCGCCWVMLLLFVAWYLLLRSNQCLTRLDLFFKVFAHPMRIWIFFFLLRNILPLLEKLLLLTSTMELSPHLLGNSRIPVRRGSEADLTMTRRTLLVEELLFEETRFFLWSLCRVAREDNRLWSNLVTFYQHHNRIVDVLSIAVKEEVTKTSNCCLLNVCWNVF